MEKKILIPLALAICSTAAIGQSTSVTTDLNSIVRFEDLDTNQDGMLNQGEMTTSGKTTVRLSDIDKDRNGSVSRTEYDAAAKLTPSNSNRSGQHSGSGSNSPVSASAPISKFEDLDTNHDGMLSRAEFDVAARLNPHGSSNMGHNNMPGRRSGLDSNSSVSTSAPISKFEDLDTNHDGILNPAELSASGKTSVRMSDADKDKNGSVSRTEYDAAAKMHSQGTGHMNSGMNSMPSAALASFEELDTDKDGVLSPVELTVHGKKTVGLSEADKDKNGSVSRTEFAAAYRMNRQESNSMNTQRRDAVENSRSGEYERSGTKGGARSGTMGGSSNSYDGND